MSKSLYNRKRQRPCLQGREKGIYSVFDEYIYSNYNMKLKLYNLMYVDLDEKRVISRKTYTNNERVDLYLKGCCVLDRSLKINNMGGKTPDQQQVFY